MRVFLEGVKLSSDDGAHVQSKRNLIYLAKSTELLSTGLQWSGSLSLVMDEARLINSQILQIFASTPLTDGVAHGVMLPPQVLPALHISLKHRKVGIRIDMAEVAWAERQKKAGNGQRVRPKKLCSDALVATWHTCLAMQNGLRSIRPDGLFEFAPGKKCMPLADACAEQGCSGHYEWAGSTCHGQCTAVLKFLDGTVCRYNAAGHSL